MRKKLILLLFITFLQSSQSLVAQLKTYRFEQIDSLQLVEKRAVIVFIHTDWCQFCQAMKAKTFKNEQVISKLNQKFYFVDFNAEEQRTIWFNNTVYKFKPSGNNVGLHELALELGTINNQISYPTLCVLNYKNEIVFQYSGFLNAKNLLHLLKK